MKHAVRTDFCGFSPEAFRFFRRLARNNHKPWFDRNRSIYEEQIKGPLRNLFDALTPVVLDLDPDCEVSGRTGKNFSRINRDIRFSKDKSPYRPNMYLHFSRRPQSDGRFYVGLSSGGITCGFAAYQSKGGTMETLLKPRRAKAPGTVDRFLRSLGRRYEIYWHGNERGEWKQYPGPPATEKDWKRCRALIARKVFPIDRKELQSKRFVRTAEKIFSELFPLYALSGVPGPDGEQILKSRQRNRTGRRRAA